MKKQYGGEKGESVFYASANKGTLTGVEKRKHAYKGGLIKGFPKLAKIIIKEDIMALNYKKSTEVKIPEQKKIVDPRSKTSIRGKNYIATGDKNSVPAKQKKPYKVTWY